MKFSRKLIVAFTLIRLICSDITIQDKNYRKKYVIKSDQTVQCQESFDSGLVQSITVVVDPLCYYIAKDELEISVQSTEFKFHAFRTRKQLLELFDLLSKEGNIKYEQNLLITDKSKLNDSHAKNLANRISFGKFLDRFDGTKAAAQNVINEVEKYPDGEFNDLVKAVTNYIVQKTILYYPPSQYTNVDKFKDHLQLQLKIVPHFIFNDCFPYFLSFGKINESVINSLIKKIESYIDKV
jgi:hypothetical protein